MTSIFPLLKKIPNSLSLILIKNDVDKITKDIFHSYYEQIYPQHIFKILKWETFIVCRRLSNVYDVRQTTTDDENNMRK